MGQQPMNLLLKLAIDLVEHFEANQLIANLELVAILKQSLMDPDPLRIVPLVEPKSFNR